MKSEKKKKIIEVSKKLFIEKGYKETKVEDITRSMGISKGNFYTYFKSKEDVLHVIIEEKKINFENLLNGIETGGDVRKTMEIYFRETVKDFLTNFSKINPGNIQDLIKSEKVYSKLKEIDVIEREFIKKNIVEKTGFKGDPDFISEFILTTKISFLFKEVLENRIGDEETYYERNKEKLSQIMEFLYKGLN